MATSIDPVLAQGLRRSFQDRAQAVFFGRISLNSIYATLSLLTLAFGTRTLENSFFLIALVIIAFIYASLAYFFRRHKKIGRWVHFLTLIADLLVHIFFTRASGFLFSPLMAIHPFLTAAFLLLFHNPTLLIFPLATLPILTALNSHNESTSLIELLVVLVINCGLDILAIFFIHVAHSNEHNLSVAMVAMEKKLKELAIIKERQRISRDLHDGVGTQITSIVLQCDYLSQNQLVPHLEVLQIKASAMEALDDMRRALVFLHGDFDIVSHLERLVEKLRTRHRLTIQQNGIDELRALTTEQQIACASIIQEALTNSLKHANATKLTVTVEKTAQKLVLSINDNGVGFDECDRPFGHFGLTNMRDRANAINARMKCASSRNVGTTISLEIGFT